MIIGTHLEFNRNDDTSQRVYCMYSDSNSFPEIADVCCVSNIEGHMKPLRNRIYSVAIRLQYGRRNRCKPHLCI